jgi:hypothetical protein
VENPLGEGGERLHDWLAALAAFRRAHGEQGGEVNAGTPVFETPSVTHLKYRILPGAAS